MRWTIAFCLLILGIGAGVLYGRYIAPVQYVDTTPASLRADYQTDYVLMVAERFSADQDSEAARRQLAVLGARSPSESCGRALSFARAASYSDQDLMLLEKLDRAMQSLSPVPTPPGPQP